MRPHDPATTSSEEDAAALCRRLYFPPSRCERLAGYENENHLVEDGAGRRYVLKASPAGGDRRRLRLELAILRHLEEIGWRGTPRWIESRHGRTIESVELAGRELEVRMLSWVEGYPLDSIDAPSPRLLAELGGYLGRLDAVLAAWQAADGPELDPPVAALWNLAAPGSWPAVGAIEPADDRRRAEEALADVTERLASARPRFRSSLIHADPNHHNVLVSGRGEEAGVAGLIDFGDSGHSVLVFELAIAAAYVGIEAADPWDPVGPLVAGYHEQLPLEERELELLLPAVRGRLALSLAMSAARRRQGDADAYVTISERPARGSLSRLASLSAEEALDRLVEAVEKGHGDG